MRALTLVDHPPPQQRIIFGCALIRTLIDCACRNTGIAPRELTGGGRTRDLVWTRWAITLVARENGRTFPQIAECLDRDHTTIIYGLRAARQLRDREFDRLVSILREEAER